MNSAALFSPFFFDFDFDFLCFFLRCDPDRLLDLERPRDDEEDDDELEEDDVDLGKKEIKDVTKCQALSTLIFENLLLLLEVLLSVSRELFSPFLDLDSPPSLLLLLFSLEELLLLLDPLLLLLLRLLLGISARSVDRSQYSWLLCTRLYRLGLVSALLWLRSRKFTKQSSVFKWITSLLVVRLHF